MTGRWRWPLRIAVLVYLGLLVVLPGGVGLLPGLPARLGTAWDAITSPDAVHALWLTLLVVLIAVPLNTVFGVGVSLILARHRFPGAWLLDAFVDIPLAVSPVVVGHRPRPRLRQDRMVRRTGWPATASRSSSPCRASSWPRPRCPCPTWSARCSRSSRRSAPSRSRRPRTLGAGPLRRVPAHHPAHHPPRPGLRGHAHHGPGLGEFGAVAVVSGAIAGRTQTLTLFIQDGVENLNRWPPTSARSRCACPP